MTFDRLGRWRLPAVAGLSLLIAVAVVVAILLLGRAPTVIDGSPSPSATTQSADASAPPDDTPEAAVRAFFEAFAEARETDDPALIEPFVNGTDSSAYQTAAGFLLGQQEVGKASIVTVNELSNFDVSSEGSQATVLFDHRLGGYDIDLESGEPVESPTVLELRRKQAVVVLVDGVWLVESFENLP
jgi:hypothetical protein